MIDLTIHTQPDDVSCGPTSLHAIYKYYGLNLGLEEVIKKVERSVSGGTLASLLGKDALKRGFRAVMYANNLNVFDPSWFTNGETSTHFLTAKLHAQMKYKRTRAFLSASQAYLDFIRLGGKIRFRTLDVALLRHFFAKKIPILTGLSATYLYGSARERFTPQGRSIYDDIRGTPCGHFVVLVGYEPKSRVVIVADPHRENPLSHDNYYKVNVNRLINAVMLGVLTYDANLLIIEPRGLNANNHRH